MEFNEFDGLDQYQLRDMLVDKMLESHGPSYTLGWLRTVYRNGHNVLDTNRDLLIDMIRQNEASNNEVS